MSDSRLLAQQIQELETYMESLADALQRGERLIGLKPVRQIFDALLVQALPPLQIPAAKFIELYNDLPSILSAYAITVNLTAAAYHSRDHRQAIFDRQPQGNYWVVMTKPEQGWLVPNPTKNTSSLHSLNFAFDISTPPPTHLCQLQLPALVQLLPTDPATWKVLQRGQLGPAHSTVMASTDTSALVSEIQTLRQELSGAVHSLQAKDASLDQRLDDFKAALQNAIATLQAKDTGLDERMDGFKTALQGLIQQQKK